MDVVSIDRYQTLVPAAKMVKEDRNQWGFHSSSVNGALCLWWSKVREKPWLWFDWTL